MATGVLNIALIGTGFMGRAHSHAWASVNGMFDLVRPACRRIVVGRDARATRAFARRWGWQTWATDVRAAIDDGSVDLVDVATPNHLHAAQAIESLNAGRHVACEKPLAGTLDHARAMVAAAVRRRGQKTFVWFNYRRCPAVALARQLVGEGRLGGIVHVRAQYLQEWGAAATPMSWRYQAARAGSGAHGDLNAHIVDLARFITGDDIAEVSGAIEARFVHRRGAGAAGGSVRAAKSSVDDCVAFLARFKGGAVATFEATRLATGNLNRNAIEINGERGAIRFDFEHMNVLQWYDAAAPARLRGWTTIPCTTPGVHAYADAYWPPGHPLGYDHTFISQAADTLRAISGRKPVLPLADFADACQTQRVLHAALLAAREHRTVPMREVK